MLREKMAWAKAMRHQAGFGDNDGAGKFYTTLWKEIGCDWGEVESKGWADAGRRVGRREGDDEETYRHWMMTLRILARKVKKGSGRKSGVESRSSTRGIIWQCSRCHG